MGRGLVSMLLVVGAFSPAAAQTQVGIEAKSSYISSRGFVFKNEPALSANVLHTLHTSLGSVTALALHSRTQRLEEIERTFVLDIARGSFTAGAVYTQLPNDAVRWVSEAYLVAKAQGLQTTLVKGGHNIGGWYGEIGYNKKISSFNLSGRVGVVANYFFPKRGVQHVTFDASYSASTRRTIYSASIRSMFGIGLYSQTKVALGISVSFR